MTRLLCAWPQHRNVIDYMKRIKEAQISMSLWYSVTILVFHFRFHFCWHFISFSALQTNSHDFLSIRRFNCCYQIAYITHKLQFNIDNYEMSVQWFLFDIENSNRFHYAKFSPVKPFVLIRWNRLNKLEQIVNDFSHVR